MTWIKGMNSPNPKAPIYPADTNGNRICKHCQISKPLEYFQLSNPKKSPLRQRGCKDCDNARRKIQYHADPQSVRWKNIKRYYKVTKEQWLAKWDAQGHKCGCCGDTHWGKGRNWHTEHNHVTKKFRGIVCYYCNTMLAMARDRGDILAAGIVYLNEGG